MDAWWCAGVGLYGPGLVARLSDELFAVLGAELDKGAVVHGWPDQTWTLAGSRR